MWPLSAAQPTSSSRAFSFRTTGLFRILNPRNSKASRKTAGCLNSRGRGLVEEVAILFREVRLGLLDSESETETRSVPNVDEAVFDHRIRQAIHDVIPPFGLALGIFESDVVLRQRRAHVHLRGDAE